MSEARGRHSPESDAVAGIYGGRAQTGSEDAMLKIGLIHGRRSNGQFVVGQCRPADSRDAV